MKQLLFILIALSILSCEEKQEVDYAILSGKIENANSQSAILEGQGYDTTITIGSDGKILDTLNITKSGFYKLSLGREYAPMYIKKGDSIHFILDANNLNESIIFSGTKAAENNYLAQKVRNDKSIKANSAVFYAADETEFKSQVSEVISKNQTTLEALEEADKDFLVTEKQNLVYDEFALLQSFQQSHAYFTRNQGFEVSDNFLPEELKNMIYDDASAYQNSNSYKQMALQKTMNGLFETIGNDISSLKPKDLKEIEEIKIPALKDEVIAYLGGFLISPVNENMKGIYELFAANTTDEKVKQNLKEIYDKNKDLMKGMPSPKFVDYENHAGGQTSLDDLKGKYVYVDVWATWCGPCKREIPFLKEVEKKFHNQNVEFVSTSIDKAADHEKWKNMVNEKDLGGTQLFADNNWQSKFVQEYGIQGIPRFILIDPDGKIVSADAPRPSDPKLTAMLEAELNNETDKI